MDGVLIRPLRGADAEAYTAFVARTHAAGELAASANPHGDWLAPMMLRSPDEGAVAELDGRLVGFIAPDPKVVVVDPALRRLGIGRALVEEGTAIIRRLGQSQLIMGVGPADTVGRAFLVATGFAYHSTLWDLELGPAIPVPPPVWPAGVRARHIERDRDIPAWVDLFNASFATHPTPIHIALPAMQAGWGQPWPEQDADIVVLQDAAGSLLGFCTTEPRRLPGGGVAPRAEIWTIGVHPTAQGRGLGRQLLRWGVEHLRGLGVETVELAVNGVNARALRLYESEGFRRTTTRDRWARPVPAGP